MDSLELCQSPISTAISPHHHNSVSDVDGDGVVDCIFWATTQTRCVVEARHVHCTSLVAYSLSDRSISSSSSLSLAWSICNATSRMPGRSCTHRSLIATIIQALCSPSWEEEEIFTGDFASAAVGDLVFPQTLCRPWFLFCTSVP